MARRKVTVKHNKPTLTVGTKSIVASIAVGAVNAATDATAKAVNITTTNPTVTTDAIPVIAVGAATPNITLTNNGVPVVSIPHSQVVAGIDTSQNTATVATSNIVASIRNGIQAALTIATPQIIASVSSPALIANIASEITIDVIGFPTYYDFITDYSNLFENFNVFSKTYIDFSSFKIEPVIISDAALLNLAKALLEEISINEALLFVSLKATDDALTVSDAYANNFSKPILSEDGYVASGFVAAGYIKGGGVAVSDISAVTMGKMSLETMSITDILTFLYVYGQVLAEAVAVVDQTNLLVGKGSADAVSTTDATTNAIAKSISNIYVTEGYVSGGYTLAEMVITDVLTRVIAYARPFAEFVSITDNFSYAMSGASSLSLTEAVSIADILSLLSSYDRPFDGPMSLADLAEMVVSKFSAEAVNVTDAFAAVYSYNRPYTEDVSLTDILTMIISGSGSYTEAITLVDALLSILYKEANEALSISDAYTNVFAKSATDLYVTEGYVAGNYTIRDLQITDAAAFTTSKSINEALSLTDVLVAVCAYDRPYAEAISLLDALSYLVAYDRPYFEAVSVTDLFTAIVNYNRPYNEAVSITDVLTSITSYDRQLPEAVSLTDAFTYLASYARPYNEAVSVTDALTYLISFGQLFNEAAGITDAKDLAIGKDPSDVMGYVASGYVTSGYATPKYAVYVSENFGVSVVPAGKTEAISMTDVLSAKYVFGPTYSEAVSLADVLTYIKTTPVYATWNPADKGANLTLSSANLVATNTVTFVFNNVRATIGKSSGKWYWEVVITGGGDCMVGIANSTQSLTTYTTGPNGFSIYQNGGTIYGYGTGYSTSYSTETIGMALDMDTGVLTIYKNNVSLGTATTGLTGTWFPIVCLYQNAAAATANFGPTFTYSPPSGYSALL
jgi:hypothetical protein